MISSNNSLRSKGRRIRKLDDFVNMQAWITVTNVDEVNKLSVHWIREIQINSAFLPTSLSIRCQDRHKNERTGFYFIRLCLQPAVDINLEVWSQLGYDSEIEHVIPAFLLPGKIFASTSLILLMLYHGMSVLLGSRRKVFKLPCLAASQFLAT